MKQKSLLFILILISLFSVSADSLDPGVFDQIEKKLTKKIKKITLENGIRVILLKRENSPTLALYTKFGVGSSSETPENAGTAHMLEHMLFKGTENIGTSNFAAEKKILDEIYKVGRELDQLRKKKASGKKVKALEEKLAALQKEEKKYIIPSEDAWIYGQNGEVGFNAYTTNDVTNYQIQLPANRLEIWAKLESDRLLHPVLRQFYTERNVVLEERRMRVEDRVFGKLHEKYHEAAFGKRPYGMPVIGYPSNLPYLDPRETMEFFETHYTTHNMVITVVGSLDFNQTEKIIRKYFSRLPKRPAPPKRNFKDGIGKKEKRISVSSDQKPYLILGWKKPPAPSKDDAVFDIISSILSQGKTGRLYEKLVLKEKVALDVGTWNGDPGAKYWNLFSVIITNHPSIANRKIEKLALEEIDILKNKLVQKGELDKIKNQLVADYIRGLDKNSTLAEQLSYYEILFGDWKELFQTYKTLTEVTPKDIQRVARKYLVQKNMIVAEVEHDAK